MEMIVSPKNLMPGFRCRIFLDLDLILTVDWLQNAEIFTLTYGSIVRQLLSDLEDIDAVNKQLDQMYAAMPALACRPLVP